MTTQNTSNTDKTDKHEQAAETFFSEMLTAEGMRRRGMSKHTTDWASEAWDNAKNELDGQEGSAETIAAMEVAETIAHAHSVVTALIANLQNARTNINAALDEIENHTKEALDNLGDGHLGDIKLWPSLQSLCRVMGTLRGSESLLVTTVETAFRSFYESGQALKVVQQAQKAHDKEMGEDTDDQDDSDDSK